MRTLGYFLVGFLPVLLLYLYRRRQRSVVSSLLLWEALAGGTSSYPRRLRQTLSLLLHGAFLLCLSLALAGDSSLLPGEGTDLEIFLVETGTEAGNSLPDAERKLEVLKQRIREELASSQESSRFALIELGDPPRLLTTGLAGRSMVAGLVDELQWHDTAARLSRALELAKSLANQYPRARLTLFSSGRVTFEDFEYLKKATDLDERKRVQFNTGRPGKSHLRWIRLASTSGIVTIRRFLIRPDWERPGWGRGVAEIQHQMDGFQSMQLVILQDQAVVHQEKIDLGPPGEIFRAVFRVQPGLEGRVTLLVEDAQTGRVVDRAFAYIPPEKSLRVVLVTDGNRHLRAALSADWRLDVKVVSPETYDRSEVADLVVLDRTVPSEPLPPVAIYIGPPAESSPVPVLGGGQVTATSWDKAHPVWRSANPVDWEIRSSLYLSPDYCQPLLTSNEGVLLGAFSKENARGVVIGWELGNSNLTHLVSFPLWVGQLALNLTSPQLDDWATGPVSLSAFLAPPQDWEVSDPAGREVNTWTDDNRERFLARRAGHYLLSAPEQRVLSINREPWLVRDVGELGWVEEPKPVSPLPGQEVPFWTLCLLLALALSVLEWCLFKAKVTD